MRIYNIKPLFQKCLKPTENLLFKLHLNPTYINISGVVVSVFLALILAGQPSWSSLLLLIPVLALIRTALNALDGMLARDLKISNNSGELFNEFFDRFSDTVIFSAFIFVPGISSALVILTLGTILLSSYLGILSKAIGGGRMYAGLMGKADRMFYLGIYAVLVFILGSTMSWNYLLVFISLGSIETIMERFWKIYKANI